MKSILFSDSQMVTPAEANNLSVFKQACENNIFDSMAFGDKIYSDCEDFSEDRKQNIGMFTPIKAVNEQFMPEEQWKSTRNNLFSA